MDRLHWLKHIQGAKQQPAQGCHEKYQLHCKKYCDIEPEPPVVLSILHGCSGW
jgi:hypothetical protein